MKNDTIVLLLQKYSQKKKPSPFLPALDNMMESMNQDWEHHDDLRLKSSLDRTRITPKLTPKYRALNPLQLELSCAPNLEYCQYSKHAPPRAGDPRGGGSDVQAPARDRQKSCRSNLESPGIAPAVRRPSSCPPPPDEIALAIPRGLQ